MVTNSFAFGKNRKQAHRGRRTAAPFDDDRLAEAEAEDNQK